MRELCVSHEAQINVQNLLMLILFGFREIEYLNYPKSQKNEESQEREDSIWANLLLFCYKDYLHFMFIFIFTF